MVKAAHPKDAGIVPNKEGTGASQVLYKAGSNDFIVVVSSEQTDKLTSYLSGKGDGDGLVPDCGGTYEDLKTMMNDRPMDFLAIDQIYIGEIGTTASQAQLESAFNTTDKKAIVREILTKGQFH